MAAKEYLLKKIIVKVCECVVVWWIRLLSFDARISYDILSINDIDSLLLGL